jgi:hypothetical protein
LTLSAERLDVAVPVDPERRRVAFGFGEAITFRWVVTEGGGH